MMATDPQQTRRASRLWVLAAIMAVVLGPFVLFRFPPACDFPSHTAIAAVLFRLLTGDPAVGAYFAPNLTTTPYHLFYGVAVPLVAVFGSLSGAKVAAGLFAALFLVGSWLILAERERPLAASLLAPLLVYNVSFFFGFMPSFAGLGPLLFGYWGLLRATREPRRRYFALAAGAGLLSLTAHPVLAPAWAASMMFSFLASAVTISTGRCFSLASARMLRNSSMPVMFGMFQSDTTKSNSSARSLASASTPSSASCTLWNPSSLSRLRTMRRIVEKSSTTKYLVFSIPIPTPRIPPM